MKLNILHEDNDIIVCEKPAGVPSQSDRSMSLDMVSMIKTYLCEKNHTSNPYLGIVHRLDRPVGGVMVFAKTKQAAAELSRQLQSHEMNKRYYAIVSSKVLPSEDGKPVTLEDYLVKDAKTNLSKVVTSNVKDAKQALLEYMVVRNVEVEKEECSLIDVHLLTGRHHQIRVQLGEHLGGIWGDTKYNPKFKDKRGWTKIALYSYYLTFKHPKLKKTVEFTCKPTEFPFS
ncbi:MAG: RluA family pseudouridine synthase [bacterium]|nr:RluA family pseudouridine synthase [bacterium]